MTIEKAGEKENETEKEKGIITERKKENMKGEKEGAEVEADLRQEVRHLALNQPKMNSVKSHPHCMIRIKFQTEEGLFFVLSLIYLFSPLQVPSFFFF
jgi:hypothetical protein